MIKVFLHIGFEKTGTTSLQEFLRHNRDHLLKQKVLYPRTPGESNHHRLAAYATEKPEKISDLIIVNKLPDLWNNEGNKKAFENELKNEVYRSEYLPETVVFSNEHCSSRLTTINEISRIKHLLNEVISDLDLKIVLYVRRQDEFIISNYNTLIMNGYAGSFDEFFQKSINEYLINYLHIIKNWESVFGKDHLIIRVYQRDNTVNHSTIVDFMKLIKITTDRSFIYPRNLNRSLDIYGLGFLRNFNSRIPYIKEGKYNSKERGNIVELLTNISGQERLKCNSRQLSLLKDKFEEQNNQIISEYAIDQPHSLSFAEIKSSELEQDHDPFSNIADSHFDIFSKLWIEKQKTISYLNKQLALAESSGSQKKTSILYKLAGFFERKRK